MNRAKSFALALATLIGLAAGAEARERHFTVTGPNGKTWSKDVTRSYDKQTGQFSRNVTKTGPNGKTLTKSTTGTAQNGQLFGQTTVTGPNGNAKTYQFSGSNRPAQ